LALAEHHARDDADVVTKLRAAGAVVLGKTNLSEWANFRSTRSTSGWSSLGGQTRNPYVLDRNPCGSSSGSAVAVAAHLAPPAVANAERLILVAEFKEDLAAYLEGVRAGPRTFDDLIEFNDGHAADVMPYFGQELFLAAHQGLGTADPGYAAAVALVEAQRT